MESALLHMDTQNQNQERRLLPKRPKNAILLLEPCVLEDAVNRAKLFANGRIHVVKLFNYREGWFEAEDIVNQIVLDTLDGVRGWPEEVPLYDYFCGAVNGKIANFLRSAEKKYTNYFIDEEVINEIQSAEPMPLEILELVKNLQYIREAILKSGDRKMLLMFETLVLHDGDVKGVFEDLGVNRKNKKQLQEAYYIVRKVQTIVNKKNLY